MANNTHGFVNRTKCTSWNIDAYNAVGISTTDMDNGTLVTLGALGISTNGDYTFTVTAPAANATGLWVVDTPAVGITLEMQMYNDPRYFYNIAGQPMSLKYLQAGIDYIEISALSMVGGTAPTGAQKYFTVNTSGQFVPASAAPDTGTYFTLAGTHTIDIGQDIVTTYVLACARN